MSVVRILYEMAGGRATPYLPRLIQSRSAPSTTPTSSPSSAKRCLRSGAPSPGVAPAVAARRPTQILHICCGTEEIPREVAAWAAAGLSVQRVVPVDLFAGTANLETMLLLASSGRVPPP